MKHALLFALLLTALGTRAADEAPPADPTPRDRHLAIVDEQFQSWKKAHEGQSHILAQSGVIADRTAQTVRVLAETTTLKANDIVEFILVTAGSGHDYEAIAVALARAEDIHRALEFIGLPAGAPYDPDQLRFWPKGERVIATFGPIPPAPGMPSVRAEALIEDSRTSQPLPLSGFVFTGSRRIPSKTTPGQEVYAADAVPPHSVISDYNERSTVLDVPRPAIQGSVYNTQRLSPRYPFPPNTLIEITLTPEPGYGPDRRRVLDASLRVTPAPGAPAGLGGLDFCLAAAGEKPADPRGPALNDVLAAVSAWVEAGRDPFVSVSFADATPLASVQAVCGLLEQIDTEHGMRIEPPPARHLYYRAFIPDPGYRDRAARPAQPWELRLNPGESGALSGTLTRIEQIWRDDTVMPDLKAFDYPVESPETLAAALKEHGPGMRVILVFANPSITHAQLMQWVEPLRADYPTIHVYVDPPTSTPAPAP